MIPERGRRLDGGDRAYCGLVPDRSPVRFLERKQAFAAFVPFIVTLTASYGMGEPDSVTGNGLVAVACFLGADLVAEGWLKNIAIPFDAKGRLASGRTIQQAIARRRERREQREP